MTKIDNWSIKKEKKIFTHQKFDIIDYYLITPDKKKVKFTYVKRNYDFSLIIPFEKGYFYMVKQYRAATRKLLIEFPMGSIQKIKSPLKVAQLELKQETGIIAKTWKKIASIYPAPGFIIQRCHIYLATNLSFGKQELEPYEFIKVVKVKIDEIDQLIKSNKIFDGVTFSAYSLYKTFVNDNILNTSQ